MQLWSLRKWHRRLGLWLGWLMFIWFLSGAVMMYAHLPRQYSSAEGRAVGWPALDPKNINLDFAQAWDAAGISGNPVRSALGRVAGRAAYIFITPEGERRVVWADTGRVLDGAGPDLAQEAARCVIPGAASLSYQGLVEVDQWTVGTGAASGQAPFHKFASDGNEIIEIYVSAKTGEVCQLTTGQSRFWSWVGAVPHWLYFTVLRRHLEVWRWSIIILAAAGCVLCLTGLWLGVKYFRLRGWGNGRRSAFLGLRKWHHYLGLAFGLPTLAWTFSGMMSLHPFDWCTPARPGPALRTAFTGGDTGLWLCRLDPAEAVKALGSDFRVKMIELKSFQGRPYYLALDGKGSSRLLPAWRAEAGVMESLPLKELTAAARDLLPGHQVMDAALQNRGDLYLPKWNKPVFKAVYDDPGQTWLYIDPARAGIIKSLDDSGRLNRWLYNFLHCLDLPWLLRHGLLRESLMLLLLGGGTLLCITGPWSRLRRGRKDKREV